MENKGQFLLYDAIMALIILFVILSCALYITQLAPEYEDYSSVADTLEQLSDTNYSGGNILTQWTNGNEETIPTIESLMHHENYQLKDLTTNRTLIKKEDNQKSSISSRKVIDKHEYELTYYY